MALSLPGKRQISEKTLELNVCAEVLSQMRLIPGYEKAVWQGLTQMQERSAGLDELLRNLGPGQFLMLQFKSPWPSSIVDITYKFSINIQQHITLEQGPCSLYPEGVYYVFPLFSTWDKVDSYAPVLANDTWLLRAADIDSATLGLTQQRHKVEITRTGGIPRVTVFSPEIDAKVLNLAEVLENPEELIPKASWVPSEMVMHWAESVNLDYSEKRLRGLHSIFIPA
ncbi:MAG: hypothetical protein IH861_13380 [Chloroflexi bacterium]|nr:hypothetical protein [Chloroflexota bacterium]